MGKADRVEIVNHTPLLAWTVPWRVSGRGDTLTVVVKGSFDLVPGASATMRDQADPPSGDVYAGGDLEGSLLHPSDFAILKPRADVVLNGFAYAKGGSATTAHVTFGFGHRDNRFERGIAVLGDRAWTNAMFASDPLRFDRVPLLWEHAFGGGGSAANPLGRGHEPVAGSRLPNLEDPTALITKPAHVPSPMSFGAVPMMWRERWSKLGTYDQDWLDDHWPYFPPDFDWRFFQAAPQEQQLDHLIGDEPFEIHGMHAEHRVLKGRLPSIRPRCFGFRHDDLFDIELALDTVVFDIEAMSLGLVWRALITTGSRRAPDLDAIYLIVEESKTTTSADTIRERFHQERDASATDGDAGDKDERDDTIAVRSRLAASGVPDGWFDAGLAPVLPPPDLVSIDAVQRGAPSDLSRLLVGLRSAAVHAQAVRERVIALLQSDGSFEGVDLRGGDLSDLDLSARSFAGADLSRCNLRGATLSRADLSSAILVGVDATDARLDAVVLDAADMTDAVLAAADLTRCHLDGTDMRRVKAQRAKLTEASGRRVNWEGADLRDVSFARAQIDRANLGDARIDAAVFDGATFADARMYGARGEKVSMVEASFERARADGVSLTRSNLMKLRAPDAVFDGAHVEGSDLRGSDLRGSSWNEACCDGADLSLVELSKAQLRDASLRSTAFVGSNLMSATIAGADAEGADFRKASLYGVETWEANLRDAKLDGADLTNTGLEPAP